VKITLIDNQIDSNLLAVNAARVSYNSESSEVTEADKKNSESSEVTEADKKLLNYLKSHKHKSPFWHAEEVKALHTSYMTMYRYMRDPWISSVQPDPATNDFLVKASVWGWAEIRDRLTKLSPPPEHLISVIDDKESNVLIDDHHPHADILSSVTLLVEDVPIPIREQLLKHRFGLTTFFYEEYGLARNEISRRYTSDGLTFYAPKTLYSQSPKNKQASDDKHSDDKSLRMRMGGHIDVSAALYNHLVAEGVSREQARFVLPQAMNSSWYWTGNVQAFARIVALRRHHVTGKSQVEAEMVAEQIENVVCSVYPKTWEKCLNKEKG